MSGIDEQSQVRVFECPMCNNLEYWIIESSNVGTVHNNCLGFLNNVKVLGYVPVFEVADEHKNISLRKLLSLIDEVRCSICKHSLVLDECMWNQLSMEIKKGWKGRGFV